MATFLEICQSVLEEVNGRASSMATTDLDVLTDPTERNVVGWVQQAYVHIQQHCLHWHFMHNRGLFLTTVADTSTYTKSGVRELQANSLYSIIDGGTGRAPIFVREYDDWVVRERAGPHSTGSPLRIIELPDDDWLLDPTPSGVWNIYADWWSDPAEFTGNTDTPPWDSLFDPILRWKALLLWASEFGGEGAGAIVEKRASLLLPSLEHSFAQKYQPGSRGASSLF